MKKILTLISLFCLTAASSGFAWDQNLELTCSTYLGGESDDDGYDLALDNSNGIYVSGGTISSNFPAHNSYQSSLAGNYDVFVTKFSSSGSSLIYSTYLGGSLWDFSWGIAVDSALCAYATGYTASLDFPTLNPCQPSKSGNPGYQDAFVSKLASSGSSLIYSTYLGGDDDENGWDIAIDSVLCPYIVGDTESSDFPTSNPYQPSTGGNKEAFVAKFSSPGSSLVYATYLGGDDNDSGLGISVDSAFCPYIAGKTESSNFPTRNSYQPSFAGGGVFAADGFVSKFSSSGSSLSFSTYLGGSEADQCQGIASDSASCALVGGHTQSSDFPTKNACQSSRGGGYDAFIAKFSFSGSSLIYSTYLGGDGDDLGYGIAVDPANSAYLTGRTDSLNFPTRNSCQSSLAGNGDAFVTRISLTGSAIVYSTYLGGGNDEYSHNIALDEIKCAYIAGRTLSLDFPTKNPYQSSSAGSPDAYLAKFYLPPSNLVLESGDYNGDGTSEIAIFRPDSGLWSIRGLTKTYFGAAEDLPVPGDYDGNDTSEIAVFRGAGGLWSVRNATRFYFGSSDDQPVPGDYNGDGKVEAGSFRSSSGLWAIRNVTRVYFGSSGDRAATGDYDGDGTKESAIFRPSTMLWSAREVTRFYFGGAFDQPAPGDYDGNGTWEAGVFRSASSMWALRNLTRYYLGNSLDQPVPADYDGNEADEPAIFRETSGLWLVKETTRIYFGATGDIPVTR